MRPGRRWALRPRDRERLHAEAGRRTSALRGIQEAHPETPVIAISGQFRPGLAAAGATAQKLRVRQVVAKPLVRKELLESVRGIIGSLVASSIRDSRMSSTSAHLPPATGTIRFKRLQIGVVVVGVLRDFAPSRVLPLTTRGAPTATRSRPPSASSATWRMRSRSRRRGAWRPSTCCCSIPLAGIAPRARGFHKRDATPRSRRVLPGVQPVRQVTIMDAEGESAISLARIFHTESQRRRPLLFHRAERRPQPRDVHERAADDAVGGAHRGGPFAPHRRRRDILRAS